jgi:hypothetical protein
MKRRRLLAINAERTPSFRGLSRQLTKRTALLILCCRPVQAFLLARIASELRCVHTRGFAVVSQLSVASLRSDVRAGCLDRRQFVEPDPPRDDFFFPRRRVEAPPARFLHERDGKRPLFVADDKRLAIGSRVFEMPLLADRNREHLPVQASGRGIRGRNQLLAVLAKNGQQLVEVSSRDRFDERLDRVFGRTERAVRSGLGCRPARKRRDSNQHEGACQRKTPALEPAGDVRSISGVHLDRLLETPVIAGVRRRRANCCGCFARERWRNVARPRSSNPRTRPSRRSVD